MYKLVNGQLLNIIEVVTPNQIALVTTTAHSVQGYDSDVPIDIDTVPDKNEPPGQIGELHYTNGALEWVYVDKPPTVDDSISNLESTQADILFAMVNNNLM
jgi:hypothetical protein